MKKIHKINVLVVLVLSMLSACVEKIDIDAGKGESQYVVEGTIVYDPLDPNKLIKDTIKITRSIGYLESGQVPTVNNATVLVIDSSSSPAVLDLCVNAGNGKYVPTQIVPKPSGRYFLVIRFAEGDTVVSYSEIKRPCYFPKDSLYTILLNDESLGRNGPGGPLKSGWGYVEMRILDSAGLGDSYRLKYWVKRNPTPLNPYYVKSGSFNGWTFLNQVNNLVTASESTSGDNSPNALLPQQAVLNFPVQRSINTVNRNFDDDDLATRAPYYPGDSIRVEVYSITRENLFFYVRLKTELTNGTGGGFSGLFATPVTNVPSNIFAYGNSKIKVLGWFGAAHKITQTTKMMDFDFNIK
jgi:hypothetical protein